MKKNLFLMISIVVTILLLSGISVNAGYKNVTNTEINIPQKLNGCEIYNITVEEAWDLLTNTDNGIQHPIDVRYDYEWYSGFVDTPYPENTHWYCLDLLKNETGLQIFLDTYAGEEVIMYCKGGYRSLVASYLICNNFTGKIYNMLGGITAWIAAGLPIRNNTAPDAPDIDGPAKGKPDVDYDFEFTTNDAENDVVEIFIDWGDGEDTGWIGWYGSGETVIINHTHAKGTFTITAQARDFYGNISELSELNIKRPRIKALNFNIIEWLFERFAALKQLLGL